MKYIPKDQLIFGRHYHCDARNFNVGYWNGEEFEYTRHKFGDAFTDTEQHWDDGEPHGTAKPLRIVDE